MSSGSEEATLAGETEISPERRGVTKRESTGILLASVVAAASAFGATVIAQHTLPGGQVSEFLVFWSLLFGLYGIVAGIQQESTRAVGAAELDGGPRGRGARVTVVSAGIGLAVAVLVAATSPLWAGQQVPSHTVVAVALVCVGVFLYAVHSALSGSAAGGQRWFLFAGLGGGEAAWRLIAMLVVGLGAGALGGLEAATVSPVLLWIFVALLTRSGRGAFAARADVPAGRLVRNILFAMASSAASAVLMVGFPVVLKASEGAGMSHYDTVLLGVLILGISITRSPIMIPLQAFQGVAISAFLKQRHRPIAAMVKPSAALLGVGLVGAGAAWLIGPWLFTHIYGPNPDQKQVYADVVHGWLLGPLTFASAIMALLVLSGTAVLALNAHKVYVLGWAVAAAVAVGLLFLPLELIPRAMIALYAGPACGFLVHLVGMRSASREFVASGAPGQ